jgi:hypothetical protein
VAVPVGGRLDTSGIDRNQVLVDALGAGVGEQSLHDHLGLFVVALAEAVVADLALGVDEVQGRPVMVVEGAPDGVVVVDRDRVGDPQVLDLLADVVEVVLEVELGGVDADDHQPAVLVGLGPGADIGKRPEPVDAGIGPEVDEDDAAAELGGRQRRRVEPPGRAVETRQVTFNRQLGRGVGGGADELVGSGEERLPSTCILVHLSLPYGRADQWPSTSITASAKAWGLPSGSPFARPPPVVVDEDIDVVRIVERLEGGPPTQPLSRDASLGSIISHA